VPRPVWGAETGRARARARREAGLLELDVAKPAKTSSNSRKRPHPSMACIYTL